MNRKLHIGLGAFQILDARVRSAGEPGLTIWTEAGQTALEAHRRELEAAAAAAAAVRERLAAVTRHATKAELFSAIERANLALGAAIERLGLCALLVCITVLSLGNPLDDDADDLARRAPRVRSCRRRDDMVALTDAETGEEMTA